MASLLANHLIDLVFLLIFVGIFIAFILEFKITSRQSWLMLLAFTAIGSYLGFQKWRRKKLLERIEARDQALKKLEKEYQVLKQQGKLTEEAYQKALKELERARLDASLAILKADRQFDTQVRAIERNYQNLSVEESIHKIKEILRERQ